MRLTLSLCLEGLPTCPSHPAHDAPPRLCQMKSGAHVLRGIPDWRCGKLREPPAHELAERLAWAVRWPQTPLCY